jgi:hypothetical protein
MKSGIAKSAMATTTAAPATHLAGDNRARAGPAGIGGVGLEEFSSSLIRYSTARLT